MVFSKTKNLLVDNSIVLYSIKNLGQFLVGVILFIATAGEILFIPFVVGASSFLLAYAAIYPFNDLIDRTQDRNNKKKVRHALPEQNSVENSVSVIFLLLISGFALSTYLPTAFQIFLFVSLLTNFLHSSAHTRFKENTYLTGPNMMIMQASKFSAGWFSQTSSTHGFPFYFIASLGLLYAFLYFVYKDRIFSNLLKERLYIHGFLLAALAFYAYSFLIYDLKLLIGVIVAYFAVVLFLHSSRERLGEKLWQASISLLFTLFIGALFIFYLMGG